MIELSIGIIGRLIFEIIFWMLLGSVKSSFGEYVFYNCKNSFGRVNIN
jgi:hypothetical protein